MKTFSWLYLVFWIGIQQLGFHYSPLARWDFMTAITILTLPLLFMLQGMWSIYTSNKLQANNSRSKTVYFWWIIGFLPFTLFFIIFPAIFDAPENFILKAMTFISGLLFLVAVFRCIWVGTAILTEAERHKFGKETWHPFFTGVAFFYLIPGMYFIDRRIKAVKH